MKQTVCLLLLSLFLAACVSDDVISTEGKRLALKAEVLPRQTGSSPRATTPSGVVTTFETDDEIGLFEIDEHGVAVVDNQRFVLQKTGLAFRVDDGGNVIASDIYWIPHTPILPTIPTIAVTTVAFRPKRFSRDISPSIPLSMPTKARKRPMRLPIC